MMRFPFPLPESAELADFVVRRYEAPPEVRAVMRPPDDLPFNTDGILTAIHWHYQNSPGKVMGGWIITVLIIGDLIYKKLLL